MNKKEVIISVVLKSVAIILMVTGVLLNLFQGGDFMAGAGSLFYFTIQSNILASIICAVGLIFDIQKLLGKKVVSNKVYNYFKLVSTTGVTLTFLVFWSLLTFMVPTSYLYSIPNLTLHTFGPILVLLDYIFFTEDFKIKKRMIMITWVFPLLYLVFAMILSISGVEFHGGAHVPYFFLDYETYGWFKISSNGIGVFYWIIIVLILVYGIGIGIYALNRLRMKRRKISE